MQKPQEYTAVFEDRQVYNDKFVYFHFELKSPTRLDFKAGQFISLLVDEQSTHRAYSIASDPDVKHGIEILLDITPNGKGVNYLLNLKFGDEIKFLAPMGRFIIEEDNDEAQLALVGTGSGIAPLKSIAFDQLKNKQDQRQITLYWGLRFANQLVWQNEFSRWSDRYSNFEFHPTLSRAEKEWPLCRGRVTNCLQIHDLAPKTGYYLCGSKKVVDDVKQVLFSRGVEKKFIHHENFF